MLDRRDNKDDYFHIDDIDREKRYQEWVDSSSQDDETDEQDEKYLNH
jgi:hypothetical protein